MATQPFEIVGTLQTVELFGPKSRPVHQIFATAEPSGVGFSFVVRPADFVKSHTDLIAHDIAVYLNKDAEEPGVEYLNVYQDVNGAGQFVNKAVVGVSSTSGDSETEIHPAYGALFDDRFAEAVARARAHLDDIEGR